MTRSFEIGLKESYFWKSTPRKIIALIHQKDEIEKVRAKNLAVYVASYVISGKAPDDEEEDDGLIAGRDKPIDPNSLSGLLG